MCSILLVVPGLLALSAKYTVPTTPSVPLGVYARVPGEANAGDFVEICPARDSLILFGLERGYLVKGRCPSGVRPLLKLAVALPGDFVTISKRGVQVNGGLVADSKPLIHDSNGRPLEHFKMSRKLLEDEIVVLGVAANSFDSRYFGPLHFSSVRSRMTHVWRW